MDEFVVKRVPKKDGYKQINVRTSTYDAIQQMKDDTGAAIADIMDDMVAFCMERLKIKE